MKDKRLRIPNITRNLYISLSVLEIIAIEVRTFEKLTFIEHKIWETGSEDCGGSWGRGAQLNLL